MAMAPYPGVCLLLSLVHLAFSKNRSPRIMGGEKVSQGKFPFVVLLLDKSFYPRCTASILNDNTILTAAHCLKGIVGRKLNVYVGKVYYPNRRPNPKYVFKGKKTIWHQNFTMRPKFVADIGVLKLERKLSYSQYIQQTCLPTAENVPDEENCIAIGWGKMEEGKMTTNLQKLNMRLKNTCGALSDPQIIFCAVAAKGEGEGGICFGDSGGPLICKSKSNPSVWIQYGVSSYIDNGNCKGGSYFMKTNHYLQWIQKHSQD